MQTQSDTPAQDTTPKAEPSYQERLTDLRNLIASRVRSDSANKKRLTCGPAVSRLVRNVTSEDTFVTSFAGVAGFEDIKAIVGKEGAVYLYSDKCLSRSDAQSLLLGEEIRTRVAERVRADSAKAQRLTPVHNLGMIPGAEPDKIDSHLSLLLDDERYVDLRLISNARGSRYLYSEEHMTATFAAVLARAEANDPLDTIVTTVREDSRIYPRPTTLATFAAPVFNIDSGKLERYANEITSRPEYADIKLVRASNGALYLYSQQFLNVDWVKATVEWEEVGKYLNP
jgi:hypothetical protein